MMSSVAYNTIGRNYNNTRRADGRITRRILNYLPYDTTVRIADIGAGTGNYAYELASIGYQVHALEPSDTMIGQQKMHPNISWYKGFAEHIPFQNDTYDCAICILASHHFDDLEKSFAEIYRILKPGGSFILFSADPREISDKCWIKDYFKPFHEKACSTLPEKFELIKMIESQFKSNSYIDDFLLPSDLKDGFFYSAWKFPEKYLSETFRAGISVFSILPQTIVNKTIEKLKQDLHSGEWDKKYGYVRELDAYNGGYYFLVITK